MDRIDILERNRKSAPSDEGIVVYENRARNIAFMCMCILLMIVLLYNLFKGQPSESLHIIFYAFIGSEALYKFHAAKNKVYLITGVAGSLATIVYLAIYVMKTW